MIPNEQNLTDDNPPVERIGTRVRTIAQRLKRNLIAILVLFTVLGFSIISQFSHGWPEWSKEFFLALTAAMAVHLLDRMWLFIDASEALEKVNQKLVSAIDGHIKFSLQGILRAIQQNIVSLQAMTDSGVGRIYESRDEASEDIAEDLTRPTNRTIRLLGISLNDFILKTKGDVHLRPARLGDAWQKIRNLIENGNGDNGELDIKVLIIDPLCFGAQLRAKGEERKKPAMGGRLNDHLRMVIQDLVDLEEKQQNKNVKFECKLYRVPPILSLYATDSVSYVQQYYFWSQRLDHTSFPTLKFQNVHAADGGPSIHAELAEHFQWIWDQASIGLKEYWYDYSLGFEKGLMEVGLINVYTDPNEARDRMFNALEKAQTRVTFQGISLHSFFNRRGNTRLYEAMHNLLAGGTVMVDVLFLDPDCEQAKFRSFREYSFEDAAPDPSTYFEPDGIAHRASTLYEETDAAKKELMSMIQDIAKDKEPAWKPQLRAGFYRSAPHCFLLRVDNSIFVEQYHYGKLRDDQIGRRVVLGKDLPLMEYAETPKGLFAASKKTAFALLESHLDFVIERAEIFEIDEWIPKKAPPLPAGT